MWDPVRYSSEETATKRLSNRANRWRYRRRQRQYRHTPDALVLDVWPLPLLTRARKKVRLSDGCTTSGNCSSDTKNATSWTSLWKMRWIVYRWCSIFFILLVENREIFIPHLYLALPQGWPRQNFVKMFDAGKTRMIGLPYGEKKLWRYVKPFSSDTGT